MDALIGKRLGQYEILSKLGSGGMAHVYRARQTSVDRDVAVKVIRTDLTEDAAFTERFAREARTIASLSHLHILKVFDYGQQDGIAYLVMELLEGGSLNTLIQKNGALTLPIAARILKQIAGALDYAHDKGIVHRDLKADNVLLDSAENAYLTDFGIARLLNDTSKMTQTGTIMGTPAYMAPELWTGTAADKRADIYALGVILYEMITGSTPFGGDTPFVIMYQHLNEVPPVDTVNPDIPEAVQEVILKAMAKKPEDRYPSAGAFANAVDEALGGISDTRRGLLSAKPSEVVPDIGLPTQRLSRPTDPTEANNPTVVEKLTIGAPSAATIPPQSSSRWGWVVGAVIAVLIVIGLFGFSRIQQQQQSEASATALALAATQTEADGPTATNTATITPTATLTATVSPTPMPSDTPAPTMIALAQLKFDTYTNKTLNVAFRYPQNWDTKVVQGNNIFVTEDYSKLDFSDPNKGIVGAPYIQISIGSSDDLGVLGMKQAKTAEDALIAFMGRDRVTNLDPVPGARYPTATSTRIRDDLGVTRYIYVTMLGADRFIVAMLQATPDVVQSYNQNVMLPLVRSVDNFAQPENMTPTATATAIPTVFFATPSVFSTQTISSIGLQFAYPQGWIAVATKQAGAILPLESSEALGNYNTNDFARPLNIYMRFDGEDFITIRNPNDSIETIFADNYGSYTFDITTVYDAPFPTAYARAGDQPVYGVAVDGYIAMVKIRDDLYISIFAHAGAGKEEAFLDGVLLPILKSFKTVPVATETPS